MEARLLRATFLVAALGSLGASYRTPNFIVEARSNSFAKQVGDAAETYRRELAKMWTGREMPKWASPCPIRVQDGAQLGAGGVTSFVFDKGHVFGWQMSIQGPQQRILDSVLPHEVSHTVFATYFRRPLPRWADEGACTTVEHASERAKQNKMLIHFLKSRRGIPFSRMLVMKEYPRDILPLYSQGYSLSRFLIEQGGRPKFVQFIKEGMQGDQWTAVVREHYGYSSLAELQETWLEWVKKGSPRLTPAADDPTANVIAMATGGAPSRPNTKSGVIFRAQSEDAVAATSVGPTTTGVSVPGADPPDMAKAQAGGSNDVATVAVESAVGSHWKAAPAGGRNSGIETDSSRQIDARPDAVRSPQYAAAASYAPGSVIPPTVEETALDVDSTPRKVLLEWSSPKLERQDASAPVGSVREGADAPAVHTATVDSLVPIRR